MEEESRLTNKLILHSYTKKKKSGRMYLLLDFFF